MKNLIIDLDDTLTIDSSSKDYLLKLPNIAVIKKLIEYKEQGFKITINTSRNMKTYEGNVGKINANTIPTIIHWLKKHKVPYDEIIVGKPWCGENGFYIDDKAIRPNEFINLNYNEIKQLLRIK
jgi:capsule biosynthesis phosphatase